MNSQHCMEELPNIAYQCSRFDDQTSQVEEQRKATDTSLQYVSLTMTVL